MKAAGHRATPLSQWFPGAAGLAVGYLLWSWFQRGSTVKNVWMVKSCGNFVIMIGTACQQGIDNAAITFPVDLQTGKIFFDLPNTAHHTLDGQHPPCMVKTLQFQCQISNDYRISTCIYQEDTKKTTSFFPEFLQQLQASLNHNHYFPMKA